MKKKIAFLTVLIILLNMFAPYSVLFTNTVYAATGEIEENPVVFSNLGIVNKGTNRILKVQVAIASEEVINGLDLKFKINTNSITPCNKNTGSAIANIALSSTVSDYYLGTFQTKTYSGGEYRLKTTEPAGGTDIVGNGYIPGAMGDPDFDDAGAGYPAYYPMITLFFKVLDDSLTADNIALDDLFTLVPVTGSLPTGMKISYNNASGIAVSKDISTIGGNGFAEAEKTVTGMVIKTDPTNLSYTHGDTIDLTGGLITVTYDDGTEEDIPMTDPAVQYQIHHQDLQM